MLLALGAASSAIDALKSLTSSKSSSHSNASSPTGLFESFSNSQASANTNSGGGSQISPETMSALLAAQSQSSTDATSSAPKNRWDALKDLFSQIDANKDGKITQAEFEGALGAGGTNLKNADSVFDKLDKDGDGSVSLDEMSSALKANGRHRHPHHVGGAEGSNGDSLMQALQGAATTSVTNSDGSVTTSLTYADGSKVTMTSAPSGSSSSAATSSYNFIEQMIQRQSQAISASTPASVSVSA